MMRNIPLKEISNALSLNVGRDLQVSGYQIDSRLIGEGDLFFALKGEKVDGHAFLAEVKRRGAIAAVVDQGYRGESFGLELLRVQDVVEALQSLAQRLMEGAKVKVVGVTGSLGKTTTKEFLATLLEGKFKVGKTWLNYNTKLTYPITLLNRRGDEDVLVVEMGMTEPGDIAKLVEITAPDVAILTKVAWVHAAYFPRGLVDIANGKVAIFGNDRTKVCIFHEELHGYPEAMALIGEKSKVSFSLEKRSADYFLNENCAIDERGVRAFQFDPPYRQKHVLHNFLAAVSAARILGLSFEEIEAEVPKLKLPKMRFEEFEREGVLFVNDAYNANPDSMRAAISSLPKEKRKIAVLGMMMDMGPDSDEIHRELGRFAAKSVDQLLCIGKGAKFILEGFLEGKKEGVLYEDFESLAAGLKKIMQPGDAVLVKASRVVGMEKLFTLLG